MAAPHEADPVDDIIAREMARLTFEKVKTIAEVQQSHGRRLATIEVKLDDIESKVAKTDRRVATIDRRVTNIEGRVTNIEGKVTTIESKVATIEGKVATIESKVTTIEGTLKDHGVLLHQILARLPEPV